MQDNGPHSGSGEPHQADVAMDRRRRTLLLIAILAVLLAGVVALVRPGDSSDVTNGATTAINGSVSATSGGTRAAIDSVATTEEQAPPATAADSVAPTETDGPTSVEPVEPVEPVDPPSVAQALGSIDRLLTATIDAIKSSADGVPGSLPDLTRILTGSLLDELEAVRAEYESEGWTQIGAPEIVSVQVVQPPTAATPTDAVVEVCLDNSAVRIVDKDGIDVREPGSLRRVLNLYVLTFVDGRWVAADHTFPTDTTC